MTVKIKQVNNIEIKCDKCQKLISITEDTHKSDGDYICDDCFEKYYCDNCGSYIGEDEKKEGNYYCSYCN